MRHLVRGRTVEDAAASGLTSVIFPPGPTLKPAGWFIQEFAATTENVPTMPAIAIGIPDQKCVHGDMRFHP